jgi:predicted protein tyrosine phosphatase
VNAIHTNSAELFDKLHDKKKIVILYDTETAPETILSELEWYSPNLHTVKILDGGYNKFRTSAAAELICYSKNPQFPTKHKAGVLYPNEIISNFLYLGDMFHAQDETALKQLGITHVLNVTNFGTDMLTPPPFAQVLQIDITDSIVTNISTHFDQAFAFIESCEQSKGRILVHCRMGVSRSASFVIAYLMQKEKRTLKDAYLFVKRHRSIIKPNVGFVDQLRRFELELFPHLEQTTLPPTQKQIAYQEKRTSLAQRYGLPFLGKNTNST